jgi:hypothetical protein
MPQTDGAARQLYETLPPADKRAVLRWYCRGYGWGDSVVYSGVLAPSTRSRAVPEALERAHANARSEAALAEWEQTLLGLGQRRETAEHEAAHLVVARYLGLRVAHAGISPDDDSGGECSYARGDDHQTATVAMAGELWIGTFRMLQFIGPPRGCERDRQLVATALGRDDISYRRAARDCHDILKANKDALLAIADKIEREGQVYLP